MIVRAVMQVEQTLVDLWLTMQKRNNKTGMPKIMMMHIHLLHHWTKNAVLSQLSPEKKKKKNNLVTQPTFHHSERLFILYYFSL